MPLSRNVRIFAAGVLQEESQRDYDWDEVRAERNQELAETDWRAVKDRTMSQAWKDYRQALRDLPQNHDTANDAVDNWPEAPE
tara:strand:+ start:242 stop:490 length:249 start_codon:yes stop_codon:yes gene_type:complete